MVRIQYPGTGTSSPEDSSVGADKTSPIPVQNLSESQRYRILSWVAHTLLAIPKAASKMITSRSPSPSSSRTRNPKEEDDAWMIWVLLESLLHLLGRVTTGLFTSNPALNPPEHFPTGQSPHRHQGWEAKVPKQPNADAYVRARRK
ncbi:hypothetical protein N7492_004423 [Penicillium capsulatum]|uniref:Uncharacterized protein n=1 Tax=Penicillium capsulatum TaxID=69766 RepID=A0A9W9IAE9_9EURO|nr:hypothetical protein N7492_004423 [Penicillium capsulatum]KAJ6136457.1 hypothetical protein N7512_001617 [Penicillium capsulatum]